MGIGFIRALMKSVLGTAECHQSDVSKLPGGRALAGLENKRGILEGRGKTVGEME